ARDDRAAAGALLARRLPRSLRGQLRSRRLPPAPAIGVLTTGPRATVRTSPALSIVIPAYNERECLAPLMQELGGEPDRARRSAEVIAVDDGSTDGSFEHLVALRASEPRLRVVRLQRNYGQTAAMAAGIELARGEVIVSLDADLQNDPHDIPALLAALRDD